MTYCDSSWHDPPVEAVAVCTCAWCGKVYARCAQCEKHPRRAREAMACHVRACHHGERRERATGWERFKEVKR
jgi:hypothetical protein